MINQEMPETRHFEVAANPTLILHNDTGSIHVRAGPSGNDVSIQATKHSGLWGSPNDIRVSYTQNTEANTITVNVDRQSHVFDWGKVNFDVKIPSTATLQLKTATGSIDVSGVSGEMLLVEASTITGSLHMNFPGVTVQQHHAVGDVGSSPQATSSLRAVTGSIKLYQR
jgi:hypothetical protein